MDDTKKMDFYSLKRKQLQSICKQHGIPANKTNLQMADLLTAALKVKGNSIPEEENDETYSEDEPRKKKKVRFSPDVETREYEPSIYRKSPRRSRRKTLTRSSMKGLGESNSPDRVGEKRGRGRGKTQTVSRITRSRAKIDDEKCFIIESETETDKGEEGCDEVPQHEVNLKGVDISREFQKKAASKEIGEDSGEARKGARRSARNMAKCIESELVTDGATSRITRSRAVTTAVEGNAEVVCRTIKEFPKGIARNASRRKSVVQLNGTECTNSKLVDDGAVSRITRSIPKSVDSISAIEGKDEPAGLTIKESSKGIVETSSRRKSAVQLEGLVASDGHMMIKERSKRSRSTDLDVVAEVKVSLDTRKGIGKALQPAAPARRSRRKTASLNPAVVTADSTTIEAGGMFEVVHEKVIGKEACLTNELRRSVRSASTHHGAAMSIQMNEIVESVGEVKRKYDAVRKTKNTVVVSESLVARPSRQSAAHASKCNLAGPSASGKSVKKKQKSNSEVSIMTEEIVISNILPSSVDVGLTMPEAVGEKSCSALSRNSSLKNSRKKGGHKSKPTGKRSVDAVDVSAPNSDIAVEIDSATNLVETLSPKLINLASDSSKEEALKVTEESVVHDNTVLLEDIENIISGSSIEGGADDQGQPLKTRKNSDNKNSAELQLDEFQAIARNVFSSPDGFSFVNQSAFGSESSNVTELEKVRAREGTLTCKNTCHASDDISGQFIEVDRVNVQEDGGLVAERLGDGNMKEEVENKLVSENRRSLSSVVEEIITDNIDGIFQESDAVNDRSTEVRRPIEVPGVNGLERIEDDITGIIEHGLVARNWKASLAVGAETVMEDTEDMRHEFAYINEQSNEVQRNSIEEDRLSGLERTKHDDSTDERRHEVEPNNRKVRFQTDGKISLHFKEGIEDKESDGSGGHACSSSELFGRICKDELEEEGGISEVCPVEKDANRCELYSATCVALARKANGSLFSSPTKLFLSGGSFSAESREKHEDDKTGTNCNEEKDVLEGIQADYSPHFYKELEDEKVGSTATPKNCNDEIMCKRNLGDCLVCEREDGDGNVGKPLEETVDDGNVGKPLEETVDDCNVGKPLEETVDDGNVGDDSTDKRQHEVEPHHRKDSFQADGKISLHYKEGTGDKDTVGSGEHACGVSELFERICEDELQEEKGISQVSPVEKDANRCEHYSTANNAMPPSPTKLFLSEGSFSAESREKHEDDETIRTNLNGEEEDVLEGIQADSSPRFYMEELEDGKVGNTATQKNCNDEMMRKQDIADCLVCEREVGDGNVGKTLEASAAPILTELPFYELHTYEGTVIQKNCSIDAVVEEPIMQHDNLVTDKLGDQSFDGGPGMEQNEMEGNESGSSLKVEFGECRKVDAEVNASANSSFSQIICEESINSYVAMKESVSGKVVERQLNAEQCEEVVTEGTDDCAMAVELSNYGNSGEVAAKMNESGRESLAHPACKDSNLSRKENAALMTESSRNNEMFNSIEEKETEFGVSNPMVEDLEKFIDNKLDKEAENEVYGDVVFEDTNENDETADCETYTMKIDMQNAENGGTSQHNNTTEQGEEILDSRDEFSRSNDSRPVASPGLVNFARKSDGNLSVGIDVNDKVADSKAYMISREMQKAQNGGISHLKGTVNPGKMDNDLLGKEDDNDAGKGFGDNIFSCEELTSLKNEVESPLFTNREVNLIHGEEEDDGIADEDTSDNNLISKDLEQAMHLEEDQLDYSEGEPFEDNMTSEGSGCAARREDNVANIKEVGQEEIQFCKASLPAADEPTSIDALAGKSALNQKDKQVADSSFSAHEGVLVESSTFNGEEIDSPDKCTAKYDPDNLEEADNISYCGDHESGKNEVWALDKDVCKPTAGKISILEGVADGGFVLPVFSEENSHEMAGTQKTMSSCRKEGASTEAEISLGRPEIQIDDSSTQQKEKASCEEFEGQMAEDDKVRTGENSRVQKSGKDENNPIDNPSLGNDPRDRQEALNERLYVQPDAIIAEGLADDTDSINKFSYGNKSKIQPTEAGEEHCLHELFTVADSQQMADTKNLDDVSPYKGKLVVNAEGSEALELNLFCEEHGVQKPAVEASRINFSSKEAEEFIPDSSFTQVAEDRHDKCNQMDEVAHSTDIDVAVSSEPTYEPAQELKMQDNVPDDIDIIRGSIFCENEEIEPVEFKHFPVTQQKVLEEDEEANSFSIVAPFEQTLKCEGSNFNGGNLIGEERGEAMELIEDMQKTSSTTGDQCLVTTTCGISQDVTAGDGQSCQLKLQSPKKTSFHSENDKHNVYGKSLTLSVMKKPRERTISIQRTPRKVLEPYAMKENAPSFKREQMGSMTAPKTSLRRPLEDLTKK